MAFPTKLLNEGEELVLDLRPHWITVAVPTLAALGGLIVMILGVFVWKPGGTLGDVVTVVCLALFVAGLAYAGWEYLKWTRTVFALTSDRIISQSGVISKSSIEIPLERINTVLFEQNAWERLLGCGDLEIESAATNGASRFENVRRPSIVHKEIYVQMEANENRRFDRIHGSATAAAAAQLSIPEQIEKLAELHEKGLLSDAEFTQKKQELLDRM